MDVNQINPYALLALQGLGACLGALALFILNRLAKEQEQITEELKQNTASTSTIAQNGARTEERVAMIASRVETIANRTHIMAQDVARLKTLEEVRASKPPKGFGERRGGD